MFAPQFRPMRTSGTQASAFCGIAGCRNVRPPAYMCKYLCISIHTDICRHMINVFPFCHDLVNSDNVVAQASEKLGTKSRVMSSRRPASHSSAHGTSNCSHQVAASGAFAAFDKSCPFRILSSYNSKKKERACGWGNESPHSTSSRVTLARVPSTCPCMQRRGHDGTY